MDLTRKKLVQVFDATKECGPYDEMPVLVDGRDPQVHVSRNDRPQPFFLIARPTRCSRRFRARRRSTSSTRRCVITVWSREISCTCPRAPRRIRPDEPSIHVRYKAEHAGLEAVAWFCPSCGAEVHREEFDAEEELPQDGYWHTCHAFNADVDRRRCG